MGEEQYLRVAPVCVLFIVCDLETVFIYLRAPSTSFSVHYVLMSFVHFLFFLQLRWGMIDK